ncbi:hypothetical protein [Enterovirga rhinocerotis]|uniref:hypothetical protein n=1 Tax=Enterovirga rhinocerotis TaxID=1339210 RepID=UPI00105ECC4D|nr:hypothetical protein [Enterovirga rhinocerotis]
MSEVSLTDRQRLDIRAIRSNPGCYGVPLDQGQEHDDQQFHDLERRGFIERRKVDGKWGFYLTPAGIAAAAKSRP